MTWKQSTTYLPLILLLFWKRKQQAGDTNKRALPWLLKLLIDTALFSMCSWALFQFTFFPNVINNLSLLKSLTLLLLNSSFFAKLSLSLCWSLWNVVLFCILSADVHLFIMNRIRTRIRSEKWNTEVQQTIKPNQKKKQKNPQSVHLHPCETHMAASWLLTPNLTLQLFTPG